MYDVFGLNFWGFTRVFALCIGHFNNGQSSPSGTNTSQLVLVKSFGLYLVSIFKRRVLKAGGGGCFSKCSLLHGGRLALILAGQLEGRAGKGGGERGAWLIGIDY